MTRQQQLDEMTRLYESAMRKMSRFYFEGGERLWPAFNGVIEECKLEYLRNDQVCRDVLEGKASIEDFKRVVTVWFHKMKAGFEKAREEAA